MAEDNTLQRLQQLEDAASLKRLVDTFSILADQKDVGTQVLLFTENATVETFVNGLSAMTLQGRDQIGNAFGAYLDTFDTVYHLNGQFTVDISGNRAKGTSYCLVVLIGSENGVAIKNTSGVYYNDEYVRTGDGWQIAKRTSHFTWSEREPLATGS